MSRMIKVLAEGLVFPEGPRWHNGRLWFSDMLAGRVLTVEPTGRVDLVCERPGSWLSGLGWLPDGRLLVVAMHERRLLRLDAGGLVEAANLELLTTFMTNDMVVDDTGRAYVGEVGFDVHGGAPFKPAALVLATPDGNTQVVDADLACPNGVAITADRRTLVVAESVADRLSAFDIRPDGTLENKRVWAAVEGLGPDGICLDAEGAVWVASPMRGEVLRLREGGEVCERIAGLDPMPLAVMLGGADGRTLFICQGPHPDQALAARSGCIGTLEVEIPGAGLP